jgi:hypothetical protein
MEISLPPYEDDEAMDPTQPVDMPMNRRSDRDLLKAVLTTPVMCRNRVLKLENWIAFANKGLYQELKNRGLVQ